MTATVTSAYTAAHAAFATTAQRTGLKPFAIRTMVALVDRGGSATTFDLADDLAVSRSAVRRIAVDLYASPFALGVADGGGDRGPGRVSRITLTRAGAELAADVVASIHGMPEADHPATVLERIWR